MFNVFFFQYNLIFSGLMLSLVYSVDVIVFGGCDVEAGPLTTYMENGGSHDCR